MIMMVANGYRAGLIMRRCAGCALNIEYVYGDAHVGVGLRRRGDDE